MNDGTVDVAAVLGSRLMRTGDRLLLVAMREGLRVTRQIGLLARPVRRLGCSRAGLWLAAYPRRRRRLRTLVARAGDFGLLPGQMRIVLAELLLRGGDQTEIMFGVLKIIFGRDRVAGCLRVARKLHVFLGDVGGVATDLHFRSVGFVDAQMLLRLP
jgi:hypothetical protein